METSVMDSKYLTELENKVLSGEIEAIRRYSTEIRAYRKSNDPEVLNVLLRALQNPLSIGTRIIIQSLPEVPEIEASLIRILETDYYDTSTVELSVQLDAVQKLEKLGTATAQAAIRKWTIGMLHTDEIHIAYACAGLRSLTSAGNIESLQLILDCLDHRDPYIRSTAINAIRRMKNRKAVPKLIELLSDKSRDPLLPEVLICDTAAQALGEIGDERAVKPIATMIEHGQTGPIPDGAIYALSLLGKLGLASLQDMLSRVESDLKEKIIYWIS